MTAYIFSYFPNYGVHAMSLNITPLLLPCLIMAILLQLLVTDGLTEMMTGYRVVSKTGQQNRVASIKVFQSQPYAWLTRYITICFKQWKYVFSPEGGGGGGSGTPMLIYKLYGYVPLWRVRFSGISVLDRV